MRKLVAPLIFILHFPLQILNLAIWALLITLLGVIKFLVPIRYVGQILSPIMEGMMSIFGRISVGLITLFNPVAIECTANKSLTRENWYLLISNHLSYLDIILLVNFCAFNIPSPKFFLKKELIWLPFVGLGAWALNMPFMKRYSREYLAKHPEKKGTDIETTKAYCQKFKNTPTTVINFVEGTRFTPKKHKKKNSPYTYLLPPKAGGIAFALATMGNLFTNLLNVTLIYPQNQKHPMMAMLCGQMKRIVINVEIIELSEKTQGDYFNDSVYRESFQTWLNTLWATKDRYIKSMQE